MFDMKLNRQFIFTCVASRKPREQSNALAIHNAMVTVTAAITYHKTNKRYYMVEANGIELLAHANELAPVYMKAI